MPETELATRPQPLDAAQVEDDLVHLVCDFHEDLALCGEEIPGDDFADDDDDARECPLCGLLDEMGAVCALPDCDGTRPSILRRLLRGRRG
jgi:hypothetical protein